MPTGTVIEVVNGTPGSPRIAVLGSNEDDAVVYVTEVATAPLSIDMLIEYELDEKGGAADSYKCIVR